MSISEEGRQANHERRESNEYRQQMTDMTLLERAQQGDTEAFGELIHTHREKAKRWAQQVTGDPHMAEDIVQDALIRAFLHVGSLSDTSRFLPWLHRIVYNQARMRLRRGGPYKKEQLFTNLQGHGRDSRSVDWEDLSSILHYLTQANQAHTSNDPHEQIQRKELYEMINALLRCLNRKERGMFEAYFFQQLSPQEIAEIYQTTTGTVYTYLHRSKQKIRSLYDSRSYFDLPQEKGAGSMGKKVILPLSEWHSEKRVRTTLMDRIGHLLSTIGNPVEPSTLMGISGFAFRMKISNKTTFADGIFIFDWRQTLVQIMEQLGYEISLLCGQLAHAPTPLLGAAERFPVVLPIKEAVIPFIRKYVDAGQPVLYFDTLAESPYVHEWSLIYGYDDDNQLVYLTDAIRPEGKMLSYQDITENPLRFLAGIDKKITTAAFTPNEAMTLQALQFAVDYARKGCPYFPKTVYLSYTSGITAYDRWIDHLRNGITSPNRYGMGQLAAVYGDARRLAVQYLHNIPLEGEAMRLALLAAEAYEQAAESLNAISEAVPFERSGKRMEEDTVYWCAIQLETAKTFETAAIGYIEKLLLRANGGNEHEYNNY
ncbi:hypothetical protein Back11_29730 [Paenibacillus baekrokdamisoli]|uniref:RNA polymerase sigma factor n=1 Tax=Paenibacillus baekrokdamisoli TaxID=1712516 RepID=A0A3G9JCH6_9BACL|nr:RNA polymerase sigma factor [Paenibacillus baekrokdamisoli]MBB3071209.1 RNA polymerase sigma factor (sigma-70 family) [Paenibacillus baekrokdamisoli]BBH21628.1 hypothetical protein Back11_29730 [Paenibacillus baekrokdamisoli]